MKRYRLMILTVLLTLVGRTVADNLSVADMTLKAGEAKEVGIELNNPTSQYAAFQFDLVLPEGITIAKNAKGKLAASLNDDRIDDHTLTVTDMGGGTYRLLSFSMTNAEFYGKDGPLVYVTLQAAEDISEGSKTATVQSQVFTEVSGTQSKWPDTAFTVTIGSGSEGPDVPEPPVEGDDKLTVETVSMEDGGTAEVGIVLSNPTRQYAAFQFDLVLPEGITIAKNAKGKLAASLNDDRIDDHTLTVTDMGGSTYRLLSFSMTNAEFYGKDGPLVYVTLQAAEDISEGSKTATVQSQVFTEVSGTQSKWPDRSFQITIEAPVVPVTVTAKSYTRVYGDANPAFEFTSEGATLVGSPEIVCEATATSPVGTYPIVIKKGTVTNYNDTYVNGTLTITKAPLAVKAGAYTKKQGEENPQFTLTYDGWKNNETEAVLTKKPVATTTATKESAPGEYPVTVSGGEAQNYELSYTNGKLVVTDADAVVVTAKSYTRVYGDANPAFEFTSEGATLVGSPEIVCEATATSPVGTYPIVIKKGTVTNYNDTYVNGTLTITKAPLTVTVADAGREQGEENPEFAMTYAGWKNGEDESVLTVKPTATTAATKDSAAGEYDIVVSGGEAENYELVYVNGVLTVTLPSAIVATAVNGRPFDVYTVTGRKVRSAVTVLKGLPRGIYIVGGRKVVVK